MARIMNWIYGVALILIAFDAMWFGIIPVEFLPVGAIIIGVLILFTPIGSGFGRPTLAATIRRVVFGIVVALMGLLSYNIWGLDFLAEWFPYFTINSTIGQIILILIGVIYLFAGTRAGNYQIGSV